MEGEAALDALAQLGELARCPICGELMDGPTFLADCSHVFCSLCVGTALAYTNDCCPVCRTAKVTTRRVAAPVLDQMIKVLRALPNADEALEALARRRKRPKVMAKEDEKEKGEDEEEEEGGEAGEDEEDWSHASSQSSSQRPRSRCEFCRLSVRDAAQHAGECLNRTEQERAAFAASHAGHAAVARPRPLAKFNYTAATSEAALRKMCGDLGLPNKGKREVLQWRHWQFVELHNANIDRAEPRPEEELRHELARLEQARFPAANPFRSKKRAHAVPWKELTERARPPPKREEKREQEEQEVEEANDKEEEEEECRDKKEDNEAPLSVAPPPDAATPARAPPPSVRQSEWQSVWSEAADRPFYFNTRTLTGSFTPPPQEKGDRALSLTY